MWASKDGWFCIECFESKKLRVWHSFSLSIQHFKSEHPIQRTKKLSVEYQKILNLKCVMINEHWMLIFPSSKDRKFNDIWMFIFQPGHISYSKFCSWRRCKLLICLNLFSRKKFCMDIKNHKNILRNIMKILPNLILAHFPTQKKK